MGHVELFEVWIFGLLLADALCDRLFVLSHGGEVVSVCPTGIPCENPFPCREVPCNWDRTFSFEVSDHTGHRKLEWNAHTHVDMVRAQVLRLSSTPLGDPSHEISHRGTYS